MIAVRIFSPIATGTLLQLIREIVGEEVTTSIPLSKFGDQFAPQPFSVTVLKSRIEHALADPASTDEHSFVEVGRAHCVHIEQRGKKGRGIS